jgi:hypothetical protein
MNSCPIYYKLYTKYLWQSISLKRYFFFLVEDTPERIAHTGEMPALSQPAYN